MGSEMSAKDDFETRAARQQTQKPQRDSSPKASPPSTSAATKRRYRRRLSKARHVVTGLADVVRGVETGELELSKARVLTYSYSVLAGAIETARTQEDFAERLVALEAQLAERRLAPAARPTLLGTLASRAVNQVG
jgi:hypothetical protein